MGSIYRFLTKAQRYSDAAKGVYSLGGREYLENLTKEELYLRKIEEERNAIRYLIKHEDEGRLYVIDGSDQKGRPSIIVYFEIGEKQLAFHNPADIDLALRLRKYIGTQKPICWNGKGMDLRKTLK